MNISFGSSTMAGLLGERACSLENFSGNPCTGFRIGQRMVVVFEIKTATFGHSVELMIGQLLTECATGGSTGAIEGVFRIIHVVGIENGTETRFVERAVVRHKGEVFGQMRTQFLPNFGKRTGLPRILLRQPVHCCGVLGVEVGNRLDQAVILVYDFAVAHHNDADTAHTAAIAVGCLKINGDKIFHQTIVLVKGAEINPMNEEASSRSSGVKNLGRGAAGELWLLLFSGRAVQGKDTFTSSDVYRENKLYIRQV